jgi:hypothetical protein
MTGMMLGGSIPDSPWSGPAATIAASELELLVVMQAVQISDTASTSAIKMALMIFAFFN